MDGPAAPRWVLQSRGRVPRRPDGLHGGMGAYMASSFPSIPPDVASTLAKARSSHGIIPRGPVPTIPELRPRLPDFTGDEWGIAGTLAEGKRRILPPAASDARRPERRHFPPPTEGPCTHLEELMSRRRKVLDAEGTQLAQRRGAAVSLEDQLQRKGRPSDTEQGAGMTAAGFSGGEHVVYRQGYFKADGVIVQTRLGLPRHSLRRGDPSRLLRQRPRRPSFAEKAMQADLDHDRAAVAALGPLPGSDGEGPLSLTPDP